MSDASWKKTDLDALYRASMRGEVRRPWTYARPHSATRRAARTTIVQAVVDGVVGEGFMVVASDASTSTVMPLPVGG